MSKRERVTGGRRKRGRKTGEEREKKKKPGGLPSPIRSCSSVIVQRFDFLRKIRSCYLRFTNVAFYSNTRKINKEKSKQK
ncbi:hypothetical protein PUN28_010184 [Cardiocondyla obscurior]|uniref:Uncharacterized protein n=1 Tax=Cardiocondyla obscurior TaxID=286306 RepID=A0AAW2FMY2_9HYME